MLVINGDNLTIEDVIKVARDGEKITLSNRAINLIKASRRMVDRLVKENKVIYGITTGFGRFADTKISASQTTSLQENLIRSHAAGVGNPLPVEVVRAMILLRTNALACGYSGISLETIELLIELLNKGITPWIPEQGSVGASGDLIPLAHMALVLIGEGKAYLEGELIKGSAALERVNLKPVRLGSKEGLALINGTQMMSAFGSIAVYDCLNLVKHADMALALTMEALQGILAPFDKDIHLLRPHPGQIVVAQNIRNILRNSKLALFERDDRVQDPYSIRCAPQVHGATREALTHVQSIISREINAVTDNPLLFSQKNKVVSGGNFHGQPLALGLDYLGMAISEMGNISERRVARLVDGSLNNGLEMFLTRHGGLNSGYMIAQYTAAALVSENKVLAGPASIDSIPTSANQEDHVSMGSISARKLKKIIDNVEQLIGIELLVAAQGIDLRTNNVNSLGEGTKIVYRKIRELVPQLDKDRLLYPELEQIKELIHSGDLIKNIFELFLP